MRGVSGEDSEVGEGAGHRKGATILVSEVPGSRKGDVPSHGASGGELSRVSVEKSSGTHSSVVSGSEHGSTSSVETGMAKVTSTTTDVPQRSWKLTLLVNCLVGLVIAHVMWMLIRFPIVRVEHLPLWVEIARLWQPGCMRVWVVKLHLLKPQVQRLVLG